jgi:hypothetical protein
VKNSSSGGMSWQVAPHGIICFALFAFAILILLRSFGFQVVTALKVGR